MVIAAGSSTLYLGRDTKVFLKKGDDIWEIPVLNGYALNQSTNTSNVTLEEMANLAGDSRRGQKQFNDSVSPAEWSFDVYVRPYTTDFGSGTVHKSVDEPLWAHFSAGNPVYDDVTGEWTQAVTNTGTQMDIDFASSNKVALGTFELYFVYGAKNVLDDNFLADGETLIYRTSNAVVNEATIPLEVNGITMISWSGMGGTIEEVAAFDASGAIREGVDDTQNFIRSRFTALSAVSSVSGSSIAYGITLTGGSITISNNVSFLTPEELGKVNQPIAHVTGTRSVSGSFSAYMDEETDGPVDLYEDILGATTVVTNEFALDFYVGGKAAGDLPVGPGIQFKIPQASLEIPQLNSDDVISLDVNFTGLPTTLGATDEIERVTYVGA